MNDRTHNSKTIDVRQPLMLLSILSIRLKSKAEEKT